eukprot:2828407-Rhodomonas_salina.1
MAYVASSSLDEVGTGASSVQFVLTQVLLRYRLGSTTVPIGHTCSGTDVARSLALTSRRPYNRNAAGSYTLSLVITDEHTLDGSNRRYHPISSYAFAMRCPVPTQRHARVESVCNHRSASAICYAQLCVGGNCTTS